VALFTGIVQGTATVASVAASPTGEFTTLTVRFPEGKLAGVSLGASVALNGTCLTVTAFDGDVASFDLIAETLRRTNLGALVEGSDVNFERSARYGDEVGGHTVSGHVHALATVTAVTRTEENVRLDLEVPPEWMRYVLTKGFVALDGCSLTVGETHSSGFCVWLIPETMRVTVFGGKVAGSTCNLEVEAQTQAIVDTVERVLAERGLVGSS